MERRKGMREWMGSYVAVAGGFQFELCELTLLPARMNIHRRYQLNAARYPHLSDLESSRQVFGTLMRDGVEDPRRGASLGVRSDS